MPLTESQATAAAYAVLQRRLTDEDALSRGISEKNRESGATQLDHFFALSPDLLALVSSQTHTWVRVNPAFTTMLGWSEKELLGRWLFDFVHPEDRERCQTVESSLRAGQKFANFEYRVLCKHGGYRWIAWHASVSSGREVLFCTGRDVTLARSTLQSLRGLNRRIQRANEELEQFVNTAGHDLQEPLRTVSMYSELLMHRYGSELPAGSADLLAGIMGANRRMQSLLRDLLDYGRLSQQPNGVVADLSQTVSLESVFAQVLEVLKSAIAESSAVITHDPLPNLPGSASQLARLLQNLFSNSIKYRRPDVPLRIHLSVEQRKGGWQFCVSDNGRGFAREEAERIFGTFKRLHGAEIPGTGLGLPICRRIVEHHSGRIWAEGKPGEGANFWFTLGVRLLA